MDNLTKEAAEKLIKFIEQGGEFVKEQAPLVVEELIKFSLFQNNIFILICLIAVFIGVTIAFLEANHGEFPIFGIGVTLCSILLGVLISIENYKIENAPRLFVLEYLRDFKEGK